MHTFSATTWVPYPQEQVFEFFSNAHNLEKITPPFLGFHVITPGPIHMNAGALIDYKLKLHGLPVRWRTLIERWNPPYEFVDVQLKGPYKRWHHTHRFTPEARTIDGERIDGTSISDVVEYQLPFGLLGTIVESLWVRRDINGIFAYRTGVIAREFPAKPAAANA
jgi:ligand-binding SRPBCC domain-containing protein